jgi:putative phage-type endonuclease
MLERFSQYLTNLNIPQFDNNQDLVVFNIPYGTKDWYEFRKNGVGGSEAATVMGIDPDGTAMKLYHTKIGLVSEESIMNARMFHGKMLEDYVANCWESYDGSKAGYVEKALKGIKTRRRIKVDSYIINQKYPWLFASVDGLIAPGCYSLLKYGEKLTNYGVYEGKCHGHYALKVYDNGFPEKHIIQAHIYMIVLELEYAEFAMFVDGHDLQVKAISRNEKLVESILKSTKEFWYERVVPAKKAKTGRDQADLLGHLDKATHYQGVIDKLEPNPDGTEKYAEYMSGRFFKEVEKMRGNMRLYETTRRVKFLQGIINKVEELLQYEKNVLIEAFVRNRIGCLDFDKAGKVRYMKKAGGKNFYVDFSGFKDAPREELIDFEVKKLDYNMELE